MKTTYGNNLFSQAKCLWNLTFGQYPKLTTDEKLMLFFLATFGWWLFCVELHSRFLRPPYGACHRVNLTSKHTPFWG
tara:strand:+ start:1295 stop:1525 length:231 start_codon:yes stop_codon:yes gene_type:complete